MVKRILRLLRKRLPRHLTEYTDSDWASSRGNLPVQESLHTDRTSHGLNAASKMVCGIGGISQFCRELGDNVKINKNGHSSAVKGILARRG